MSFSHLLFRRSKSNRKNFVVVPTVVLLTLALGGWSLWNSSPDCGSADTQKLVVQIAKDNSGNKLTNFILQHSPSLRAQVQKPPSSKLLEENLADQETLNSSLRENRSQILKAADSIQLVGASATSFTTCGEFFGTSGLWFPQAAEQIGKAIGIYLNGGDYKSFLNNSGPLMPQCVEPLAPFFAKEKTFQDALAKLKIRENDIRSQTGSEQNAADRNVRDSSYILVGINSYDRKTF